MASSIRKEENQPKHLWRQISIFENPPEVAHNACSSKQPTRSIRNFLKQLHWRNQSSPRISISSQSSVVSVCDITYSDEPSVFRLNQRPKFLLSMLSELIKQLQESTKKDLLNLREQVESMFVWMRGNIEKIINEHQKLIEAKDQKIRILEGQLSKKIRVFSLQENGDFENREKNIEKIPIKKEIKSNPFNKSLQSPKGNYIQISKQYKKNDENNGYTLKSPTSVADFMKKRFNRTKNSDTIPQLTLESPKPQETPFSIKYLSPRAMNSNIALRSSPSSSTMNSILGSSISSSDSTYWAQTENGFKQNHQKGEFFRKKDKNFTNREMTHFLKKQSQTSQSSTNRQINPPYLLQHSLKL